MNPVDILDSDILDAGNRELLVAIADDGTITVVRLLRDIQSSEAALVLTPDAAHELGNKLRLAARKAGQ